MKLLVVAYSDHEPSTYLLYDTASGKLTEIGKRLPEIDPKRMARVDVVKNKARDGLEIPARLTLPRGEPRRRPLVVLVHPGPWRRGGSTTGENETAWGWHAEAQFLASRGYAVLQPEFRGSRGFGSRLFNAGAHQWGLAMQDDLADGAQWAAEQGFADPKRVCVAGAGYGGYAALMGVAKHPDVFRCAVALQAITDLEEYSSNWQYFNEEDRIHGIPLLLGDPQKDAARLRATSPLSRAADIKQPVFLAHWDWNRLVPFFHGAKMRDALKARGMPVEWVEYSNDWTPERDFEEAKDVWTRIEKFLERHLAQP
jgi:dipeptidyl aminopeptidase/acylaminoacyl peptidase